MFVKSLKVKDNEGKDVELKLVHNALTYIKYKNYTGRDLLDDTMNIGLAIKGNEKTALKAQEKGIESLNDKEVQELIQVALNSKTSEYILFLTSALIATARHPEYLDFNDIIAELPDDIMYDSKFMETITEFMLINVDRIKKKVVAEK